MEVALRWARAEANLDTLSRMKGLCITPVKTRKPQASREGRKAAAAGSQLPDADDQIIADAMLQSAAEAKAMAAGHACTCAYVQSDSAKDDLRSRVRAARALLRSNWRPRFHVGAVVECRYSNGWYRATIRQQRYREQEWGKGRVAAYQCLLEDGTLIYAPLDHDSVVRKLELIES
eukprot:CAMPEP_0204578156 /NCGR_PEP_ID=MMETSP0661-20131031/42759_1 /ASSEMBLY_ACC=CAM_ASM_000606 /TAXON_ID=109239 /ORGANISM="Alexandrium margalefi, Strain AMGDE01CS-322" /LENGTH=175 /DNA_ID=CAMNT_0051587059 /DNA_START=174 /DNA_END=701 /DNA_ORIENTATION=+